MIVQYVFVTRLLALLVKAMRSDLIKLAYHRRLTIVLIQYL